MLALSSVSINFPVNSADVGFTAFMMSMTAIHDCVNKRVTALAKAV